MPFNTVTNSYYPEVSLGTVASGTVSWNADAAKVASASVSGSCTIANPTNQLNGAFYSLKLNYTGVATIAWGSAFKFPSGIAPSATGTASTADIFTFRSDGTSMFMVGQSSDVR